MSKADIIKKVLKGGGDDVPMERVEINPDFKKAAPREKPADNVETTPQIEKPVEQPKLDEKKVEDDAIPKAEPKQEEKKPELASSPIDEIPEMPTRGRIDELIKGSHDATIGRAKVYQDVMKIDKDYMIKNPIHVNPDTFAGKEIVNVLAKTAEMNKDKILGSRRGNSDGVLTDDMLESLAKDLGQHGNEQIQAWKNRLPASAINAETVLLMKNYLTKSALKLKELSGKVIDKDNVSDKDKVEFSQAYAEHLEVYDSFMGYRAEAGRSMRAFGLKTEVDMDFQDVLAHIETGMDINAIARTINATDTVEGLNKAAKSLEPGALKRVGNAVYEMWINSILSGVKTMIVNTMGGALQLGAHKVDTFVASFMGKDPFKNGIPTEHDFIEIDEVMSKGFASLTTLREAHWAAWKVTKTGEQYAGIRGKDKSSKVEVHTEAISAKALGFDENSLMGRIADMAGGFIRLPTERLMGGQDAFFRVLAEHQSISEQAFRMARQKERNGEIEGDEVNKYLNNLIENPTEQMKDVATDFSKRVVFQQDTKTTDWIKNLRNQDPFGVTKWIIPFVRTPLNLASQAFLERSPLGVLSASIRADLVAGGARGQMARARLTTGTAITLSFYSMAYNGEITGSEPQDKARRDAWRQAGIKPRSFRFKNDDGTVSYISYDRLEPFSFIFGASADIAMLQKDILERAEYDDEAVEADKLVSALVLGVTNNILDKTFMSGVHDAITAISRGGDSFYRWARNYGASAVPYLGFRRDITKLDNETMRMSESLFEDIKKNMLSLSEELPARLDIYGKEVKYDHVWGMWNEHVQTKDKVRLEIARLASEIRTAPVSQIGRIIGGVKLNSTKYNELIKLSREDTRLRGLTFKETLDKALKSYIYQGLNDNQRVDYLKSIQRKFDNIGRNEFMKLNQDIAEEVEKRKLIREGKYNGI